MKSVSKWIITVVVSAFAIVLAIGANSAFAQEPESTPGAAEQGVEQGVEQDVDEGSVEEADPRAGRNGFEFHRRAGSDTSLAEALGVSVEELESARQAARDAALQQAVEAGTITQEQATQLQERGRRRGAGIRGIHLGEGNQDELLADALGIPVETLEAAEQEARDAALAAAIAEGRITQEQADLMAAREALKGYIDRDEVRAGQLGLSVEEVEAAQADGTLRELLEAQGLDREAMQATMQAAQDAAIEQALADGVITTEQAEQLRSGEGQVGPRGSRGGRGFGGRSFTPGSDA